MAYFNPVSLLPEVPSDVASLKDIDLKKLRKQLLAELSLSDDETLEVAGATLSKDDILKGLEELTDEEKAANLLFLYQHKDLSDFLEEGNPAFLQNFKADPAFERPELRAYIGKNFAERYNSYLGQLYDENKVAELEKIKTVPLLADTQHESRAYHRVASRLEESRLKLTEVKELLDQQINAKGPYRDAVVSGKISEAFSLNLVNALPEYFQKQRNSLAESLRAIAIQVNNDFGKAAASADILDLAANLETDGLIREKLKKDSQTIKQNVEDEKIANKCFFCEERDKDTLSQKTVPMYKVINVEHGFNSRRIQYKSINIPVNRCPECKKAHNRVEGFSWISIIGGIIGGIFLASLFGGKGVREPDFSSYLIGAILGLAVGWVGSYLYKDYYYHKVGTSSPRFSKLKNSHPLVKRFKSEGFVSGSKPS